MFNAGRGVPIAATQTFSECPKDLDILFVPGGLPGTVVAMRDPEVLDFLSAQATSIGQMS